jgi:uncharacterized protein with HEPN domain
MKKHEKIILDKISAYAKQAMEFKGNTDFLTFSNDKKTIAACVHNLSQIGELVGRLDDDFIESNQEIPWRKIRGMRNRIVHDYEGIKLNIVWDVLQDFLPELIKAVDEIN